MTGSNLLFGIGLVAVAYRDLLFGIGLVAVDRVFFSVRLVAVAYYIEQTRLAICSFRGPTNCSSWLCALADA